MPRISSGVLNAGLLAINAHPRLTLLFYATLLLLSLQTLVDWKSQRWRLNVDPAIDALLPRSGAEIDYLRSIHRRFSSDDLVFVLWTGDEVFTPHKLAQLKKFSRSVERLPGVEHVESLSTAMRTRVYEDYTELSPYLAELPEDNKSALEIRDSLNSNPLYAGYLASNDGRGVLVSARISRELAAAQQIALVAEIAELSDQAAGNTHQFLSGPLYVRLEISRLLVRGLYTVMPLAIVITAIVLMLGMRSVRATVWPIIGNLVSVSMTLLLFYLSGRSFNYVTVILPPTIYVIGFAYSLHLVSEFETALAAGDNRSDAVKRALQSVSTPVSLTALTTAVGFASLGLSSITSISDFGLYAALGVCISWVVVLTLIPAGLATLSNPRVQRPGDHYLRIADCLARVARRHPRRIIGATFVLLLVALIGISRIGVNTDYLNNFSPDSSVRSDFEHMNKTYAGAVPLQIVLEATAVDTFKTPAALRALVDLQRWLVAQPEIGGAYTLVDYVGELERALAPEMVDDDPVPASKDIINHLLLLGGSEDVRRFVDSAYTSSLIQVRTREVASADLNRLSARIEQQLAALPAGIEGRITGSSYLIAQTLDAVTRGQIVSLAAAMGPIILMMMLMFGSLRLGLLAFIPNALPLLGFFALLGFGAIPLNLTTSLVASVALGIAVDDSIHFFSRLRSAMRAGEVPAQAVISALRKVIRPVTLTTLGLALGFASQAAASLRSQAEFGLLAAATLIMAWLIDLSVSPALGHLFGADKVTDEDKHSP